MRFPLEPRPVGWAAQASVRIERTFTLPALPGDVFAVLGDLGGWDRWFTGMRRVDVLGPRRRDVWVGAAGVREQFVVWEDDVRLGLVVEASNLPFLGSMVEDWRVEAAGGGSLLTVVVAAEGAGPLRRTPALIRAVLARSTAGAAGITSCWGAPSGGPTPAGG